MNRVAPIAGLASHLGRGVQHIARFAALDDLDTVSLLEKSL
ncbi:MAG TPA: hypothetical protein VHJ79_18310 [Mycobacterium sp.]|nr:hypothetical protein [Mycobacterium sp.]